MANRLGQTAATSTAWYLACTFKQPARPKTITKEKGVVQLTLG
jgi:hypothetical protein